MVVAVCCLSCRNYFVRMYVGCPLEFRVGMLECGSANLVKQISLLSWSLITWCNCISYIIKTVAIIVEISVSYYNIYYMIVTFCDYC